MMAMAQAPRSSPQHVAVLAPKNVILWRDVFVVIDDGRARAIDYLTFGDVIVNQAREHAGGVGGLVIIPKDAVPPGDEVRSAINGALARLEGDLRCFTWLVEGGGFQGAMCRAVLTGIRMFGRHKYPTHIADGLEEALAWMLPHLGGGTERLREVTEGARLIRSRRGSPRLGA